MPNFTVYYHKTLSTWNQERKSKGSLVMKLGNKPSSKEFPGISKMLEEQFLKDHRGNLKNLADITYKVTKVVPVK